MFKSKIKYLPKRKGERYASALTNLSFSNKVYKKFGKIYLKDYINSFIKSQNNINYENSKFIKSLKKRDLNSKVSKKKGRVYIINKKILNLKQDKNRWIMMGWFYKVCFVGIIILVLILLYFYSRK